MTGQERKFLIGRDNRCDIVLDDPSVSRHHAELLVFDDGLVFYTDCASRLGSQLLRDGRREPLHQEVLMPGDHLVLGELELPCEALLARVQALMPNPQRRS